jgi:hypothetical protein
LVLDPDPDAPPRNRSLDVASGLAAEIGDHVMIVDGTHGFPCRASRTIYAAFAITQVLKSSRTASHSVSPSPSTPLSVRETFLQPWALAARMASCLN